MLEDNKKSNPLDSNLPNPTDPSDPTFTYYPDNDIGISWTLKNGLTSIENGLTLMGWLFIVVGFLGSLILGLSLETVKEYSTTHITYNTPHPMRWIFAGVTFLSSLFSAFIMFGLAAILKRLDNLKLDTDCT